MQNYQRSFFYDLQILVASSAFHRKYYLLFKSLDLSGFPDKKKQCGRLGYSQHALLKAFIIKHLEDIKTVPRLLDFLDAHPLLSHMCGFNIGQLPDASQFYRFLKHTPNSMLESIHQAVNSALIHAEILSLDTFIIDSKPVMAATKDNNFKNPNRNTRNKNKKPNRNPSAALGYLSYQQIDSKKNNFIFFWGYRTHVIVSKEGIPLVELTLPNNKSDTYAAKRLIRKLKRIYRFSHGSLFIADAAYDERDFYNFIVNSMKSHAFIPINPRNQKNQKTFGPNGSPLCMAGLEMKSNGSWIEGNRKRAKFRCPLKMDSKLALKFPRGCPISHPKFAQNKAYGCTKYLDLTDDARSQVPRDTPLFKKTFSLRTEVERYFARLGDREAEQTTHYKLRSIQNQMTIAHLSLSLVAAAAALLLNQPDKIRCFRTFASLPKAA